MRRVIGPRIPSGEYKRLFLLYASVLMIPLLVSSIFYFVYAGAARKEAISSGQVTVQTMQKFVDNKLDDILDVSYSLIRDGDVIEYASYSQNDYTPEVRYNIRHLFAKLNQFTTASEYIDGIYLIFPRSNSLVTEKFQYHGNSADYKSKELFNNTLDEAFLVFRGCAYDGSRLQVDQRNLQGNLLYISRTIVNVKDLVPIGLVVTVIDLSKLSQYIGSLSMGNSASVILSRDSQTFLCDVPGDPASSPVVSGLDYSALESSVYFTGSRNDDYAISCAFSQKSDLKYVYLTPLKNFFSAVNQFKTYIVFCIFLCVFLGGITVFLAAKRSYKPLEKLLQAIAHHEKSPSFPFRNEYHLLENVYQDLLDQHEQDEQIGLRNQSVLKEATLKNLLLADSSQEECLEFLRTYFPGDTSFRVLHFGISNYSPRFFAEDKAQNLEISHAVIKSLAATFEEKGFHVCTVAVQDAPASVIGFSEHHTGAEIEALINHIIMIVREHCGLNIKAGISEASDLPVQLHLLYTHARDTSEYLQLFSRNETCLTYESIGFAASNDPRYADWIEQERAMNVHIRNRDIARAAESARRLFQSIIDAEPPVNMEILRNYIPRIKQLVWSTVDDLTQAADDNDFILSSKPYERMQRVTDIYQLQDTVCDIFYELADYLDAVNHIRRNGVVRQIIEYIDAHYSEYDLSVAGIAELVGSPQSQISKLFKDQIGTTISEYIHQVRIFHVKDKLINQKQALTLQEIAEQTGFTNTWTMNRVFRQYEQVSPGEYRKMNSL